jgi:DNA-directed RNA polymerase specialized sigma24 family protein
MVEASLQIDGQTLAQRMSQGDEEALRMVLATFGPKVKGWLVKHFGGVLDRSEIDEAFNVAAFNVWRFADRFDEAQGSFGGWYLKIAQRAAENILRRSTVHRNKNLEYDPAFDPTVNHSRADDDAPAVFDSQAIQDLERVIDERLVGLQQAIIRADLAAGDQADNERLAERHRTTVNSIKVSRTKARANIFKAMVELGYDETGRKTTHG